MKQRLRIFIIFTGLLLILSGCLLPGSSSEGNEEIDLEALKTEVAATLMAEIRLTVEVEAAAQAPAEQPAEAEKPADEAEAPPEEPTITPSPTNTLDPTPTFTVAVPQVSVSVDTNCRTGPGQIFDWIGALVVGEVADVIAVPMDQRDYVVIKDPDGGRCWLWLEYATITGDLAGLPQWDIPATPTPVAGSIAGIVWEDKCEQGGSGDPPEGCVKPENDGDPYPANGIFDAGEDVYEAIEVTLGIGACPVGVSQTTTTAADGSYKFDNIMPGTYCIDVEGQTAPNNGILPTGKWSYPAGGSLSVVLASGENKTTVSFGWDETAD